jgi:hypothetical protein
MSAEECHQETLNYRVSCKKRFEVMIIQISRSFENVSVLGEVAQAVK